MALIQGKYTANVAAASAKVTLKFDPLNTILPGDFKNTDYWEIDSPPKGKGLFQVSDRDWADYEIGANGDAAVLNALNPLQVIINSIPISSKDPTRSGNTSVKKLYDLFILARVSNVLNSTVTSSGTIQFDGIPLLQMVLDYPIASGIPSVTLYSVMMLGGTEVASMGDNRVEDFSWKFNALGVK